MLRRRYHQKEKIAGKAKGRQKAHAPVRHGAGSQRGVYRCAEDGFLSYRFAGEADFPWSPTECLCFTGHRFIPPAELPGLQNRLRVALRESYAQGKRIFLSGGALGFDTLAAREVLTLRREFPQARLVLAVPCPSQASRWAAADQQVYRDLTREADQVLLISPDYYPGCMQKRNRFLVDHADICLCYLTHCRGGTWYTVSYAYDQGRRIRNLATENQP